MPQCPEPSFVQPTLCSLFGQTISWTNGCLLVYWTLETNFGKILINIQKKFLIENTFGKFVCQLSSTFPGPPCDDWKLAFMLLPTNEAKILNSISGKQNSSNSVKDTSHSPCLHPVLCLYWFISMSAIYQDKLATFLPSSCSMFCVIVFKDNTFWKKKYFVVNSLRPGKRCSHVVSIIFHSCLCMNSFSVHSHLLIIDFLSTLLAVMVNHFSKYWCILKVFIYLKTPISSFRKKPAFCLLFLSLPLLGYATVIKQNILIYCSCCYISY